MNIDVDTAVWAGLYTSGSVLFLAAVFIAFRGIWAIYIHSNVRFPIGPLRMLISVPRNFTTGTMTRLATPATAPAVCSEVAARNARPVRNAWPLAM